MELTFHVGLDEGGLKRKRPQGACESCRRRKKKCHHGEGGPGSVSPVSLPRARKFIAYAPSQGDRSLISSSPSSPPDPGNEVTGDEKSSSAKWPSRFPPKDRSGGISSVPDDAPASRFLGNLNPLAFLASDERARLLPGHADRNGVGMWLDRENEILQQEGEVYHSLPALRHGPPKIKAVLPTKQSQRALIDVYFQRLNPVLPLVNEDHFRAHLDQGTVSPYLLQAICLAASKDHRATPLLRMATQSTPLSFQSFSKLLYDDLTHSIALKYEKNKVRLIQILSLLSLHVSDSESSEMAPLYLGQAVHHAHTLGLHLGKHTANMEDKTLTMLFWCLWSLDRWNAAINGRPLAINDLDMGQDLASMMPLFDKPFRVWMCVSSALGKALELYRPARDLTGNSDNFDIPTFEAILDQCNGWDLPLDQILTFELAYHAVALIASRLLDLTTFPRSQTTNLNRDLSVYRISVLSTMSDMSQFIPLPIVAYAISLGFSLSYKTLKASQLLSRQYVVKQHLQTFYDCLKILSPKWFSAQVMVRLGLRALDRIQRVTEKDPQIQTEAAMTSRDSPIPRLPPMSHSVRMAETSNTPGHDERIFEAGEGPSVGDDLPALPPNPESYDFTGVGAADFYYSAMDPMFADIDNFLGDFLNFNLPD
ncbi:hypothetical protein N7462_000380 [Penicillium macrosclerotiorum]|uniref:uncharacterized protein n=1 Tax=Penicillium macrosclerotiorum TaxID=303699 RepID=UPI00254721EA|nr:uncharacterized protein N7462_000380 [Penicillium macrosclerotiorum]KAJ5698375.1 hypothetical protein N7462_000380 [Penicillium macrosclerotiorum]